MDAVVTGIQQTQLELWESVDTVVTDIHQTHFRTELTLWSPMARTIWAKELINHRNLQLLQQVYHASYSQLVFQSLVL